MRSEKIALRVLYVLAIYVLLQLIWWGYQLIQLNSQIIFTTHSDWNEQYVLLRKKMWMVAGEGAVFFILLAIGFRYIKRTVSKELAFARREKNFLLSVTHELKTPIAAVKLFLETLQTRALDSDQRARMMAQALQETKRLQSLTENILMATRMDEHGFVAEASVVDWSDLLEREVQRFRSLRPGRIKADITSGVRISGDEQMLSALVVNLLDNAFKYSPDDACVDVGLQIDNERSVLTVSDHGKGIPQEERKEIFKKFYRSGNEETRSTRGTGLGLFIVASVARLHKAEIEIMNNEPQGSIFVVRMKRLNHEA